MNKGYWKRFFRSGGMQVIYFVAIITCAAGLVIAFPLEMGITVVVAILFILIVLAHNEAKR